MCWSAGSDLHARILLSLGGGLTFFCIYITFLSLLLFTLLYLGSLAPTRLERYDTNRMDGMEMVPNRSISAS